MDEMNIASIVLATGGSILVALYADMRVSLGFALIGLSLLL